MEDKEFTNQEAIVAIFYGLGILSKNLFGWFKSNFHRMAGIIWFIGFSIAFSATGINALAATAVIGALLYSLTWITVKVIKK